MKKLISATFLFFIFLLTTSKQIDAYDPLNISNNKFGIHVQSERDFEDASKLVNSSGGDWGYVTFVIAENEKDTRRWQKAFDEARRLHLIPIVRIATKAEGENWKIPNLNEIPNWITFLDSLNWVIQNRYVIIGNEPNHAKEWGGKLDPNDYASYLYEFSKNLKNSNGDYFILPAGLDLAAGNTRDTMDASRYYQRMFASNPQVFDYVDGLASHSYPNPNFSGSEYDSGRKSIRGYEWELNYLKKLGLKKDLPVFITETGWIIEDEELVAKKFKYAYQSVWSDPRIVAVTPFILNYPIEPFDKFSWKKLDGSFKKYYNEVANLPKVKGRPIPIVKAKIIGVFMSPFHLVNSSFKGAVLAQNLGQSIWATPEISVIDESKKLQIKTNDFDNIEPFKYKIILFEASVDNIGKYKIPINLNFDGKNLSDTYPIEFVVLDSLPQVEVKENGISVKIYQLWNRLKSFLGP